MKWIGRIEARRMDAGSRDVRPRYTDTRTTNRMFDLWGDARNRPAYK